MTRRGLRSRLCVWVFPWCQRLNQNAIEGHTSCVSLHVRSFLLVPPGRLERPRTAPEAAALSAELRGHTIYILAQAAPIGKNDRQQREGEKVGVFQLSG
jgi:hypothetical protein